MVQADFDSVLQHSLEIFGRKFNYFRSGISGMDELFEASFTSVAEGGKPLSRCRALEVLHLAGKILCTALYVHVVGVEDVIVLCATYQPNLNDSTAILVMKRMPYHKVAL